MRIDSQQRRYAVRRQFVWPTVILLLAASASSCAKGGRLGTAAGTTIVIGTSVDMTGVNQLTGSHTRFSQDVLDLMFLKLFEEQPDFASNLPTFRPELARDYSWSDDGYTLLVTLRDDVLWSDGRPVTAEDVSWTFEAQTHPDVAWAYASSKRAIAEVEVRSEYAVSFRFSEIYPTRLADVNEGVILPRHEWSRLPFPRWRGSGNWFVEHLVVNGPFQLDSWRPGDEIALVRNPLFFRPDLPKADRAVFRVVPSYSSRLRRLLHGDLDFVEQIRAEDLSRIEASRFARAHTYWHRQYSFVVWNACRAPFSDARVRQAMSLAIDRAAIVEALFDTEARVGIGPIPRSVWAFDRSLDPLPYDPARAKALLAAAGWHDADQSGTLERGGIPLRFDLSTNADNSVRLDAATMIQEQLRRVGVEVQITALEFNTLLDRNLVHDFDATIGAWGIDTTLDLSYAFHTRSIANGYNYGCYSNPEVDRLIDDVAKGSDLHASLPHLHTLQQLIHADQPYTFLWEPRRSDGVGHRLHEVRPTPLSAFSNLEEWVVVDY